MCPAAWDAGRVLRNFHAVQTERIWFPLILFGKKFDGVLQWMQVQMQQQNSFIGPDDLKSYTLTDDPQEALNVILEYLRRVGPPERVPKAFS
jgi:predicted Rossmann-fold nucleotide-binding protein